MLPPSAGQPPPAAVAAPVQLPAAAAQLQPHAPPAAAAVLSPLQRRAQQAHP